MACNPFVAVGPSLRIFDENNLNIPSKFSLSKPASFLRHSSMYCCTSSSWMSPCLEDSNWPIMSSVFPPFLTLVEGTLTLAGGALASALALASEGGALALVSKGGALASVSKGGALALVSKGGALASVSKEGALALVGGLLETYHGIKYT